MNWKITRDHIIRLVQTETQCWHFQYPFRKLIMDMAKLQKRINNPQLESAEFQLSMPHYQDTLTLWSSEFDSIRNEFNTTSFAEYTSSILELEYRLENITPRWHPEVARILLYHYEITELWYLKDKRSLKYVTDQLPSWPTLINNDRLMQAVFS